MKRMREELAILGGPASSPNGQPVSFNRRASVVCLHCGRTARPGHVFAGCEVCGIAAPMTMAYQPSPRRDLAPRAAAREARRAFAPLSPVAAGFPVRPPTPLVAAPRFGPGVFIKNEADSLTASHKDRYHAVAACVARLLRAPGIVTSSTGNHGASAAAHAAAVGLPTVVFCHRDAPAGLLRAIGAFGGVAAQVEPEAQRAALLALVDRGWFPATSLDPVLTGAANPFAAEGYKPVAYEIVEQLGALPQAVFVPTAGGDTYFGIMKGFAELAELTALPMPVVFAVQPEGANPLSQSVAAGRQVTVPHPASIALSLADAESGRHAMIGLTRWGGQALDVTEDAIYAAIADLAASGIYPDPASAAALAGYRHAISREALDPAATAILFLTSSGFKWPDAMAEVFPAGAVQSVDDLWRRLAAPSPVVSAASA
jgi:threonine synthase